MNLKNVYWYFDGAFSPKLCDEIIKYGNQHSELLALTGAQKEKNIQSNLPSLDSLNGIGPKLVNLQNIN